MRGPKLWISSRGAKSGVEYIRSVTAGIVRYAREHKRYIYKKRERITISLYTE